MDIEKKVARKKFDLARCVKMRFVNGNTLDEIGDYFGISHQAISKHLERLDHIFKDHDVNMAISRNYSQVLEGLNGALIQEMLQPERLKDPQLKLNQIAFAQSSIDRQLRLEAGKSTSNDSIHLTEIKEMKDKALNLIDKLRSPACE